MRIAIREENDLHIELNVRVHSSMLSTGWQRLKDIGFDMSMDPNHKVVTRTGHDEIKAFSEVQDFKFRFEEFESIITFSEAVPQKMIS